MDDYISRYKRIAETSGRYLDKTRYFLALLRVGRFKLEDLPEDSNLQSIDLDIKKSWNDLIKYKTMTHCTNNYVINNEDNQYGIRISVRRETRSSFTSPHEEILILSDVDFISSCFPDEHWVSKSDPDKDFEEYKRKYEDFYWRIRTKQEAIDFINSTQDTINSDIEQSIYFVENATGKIYDRRFSNRHAIRKNLMTMQDLMFWKAWFKFMGII